MKINEIFESISGEAGGYPQGTWVTVVRLQGCNLRCDYCDTAKSQTDQDGSYKDLTRYEVLDQVKNLHVLITGGEPLLQTETWELVRLLQDAGHIVQVETNGSIRLPLTFTNKPVYWIIDRKGPSSGEMGNMMKLRALTDNIRSVQNVNSEAHIKWVVGTQEDIEHMIDEIKYIYEQPKLIIPFIISPMNADGTLIPQIIEALRRASGDFFEAWMANITISIQLHKICGMP